MGRQGVLHTDLDRGPAEGAQRRIVGVRLARDEAQEDGGARGRAAHDIGAAFGGGRVPTGGEVAADRAALDELIVKPAMIDLGRSVRVRRDEGGGTQQTH
ncbi:hypothetical protein D3C72_1919100 [compost metagenome]